MFKLLVFVVFIAVIFEFSEGHGWGGWGGWRRPWRRYRYHGPHGPHQCVPRVFDPNAKTLSYAGKNYIFSAIKLNFMAAQAACKSACGTLVAINSATEQNFINANTGSTEAWYIGLARVRGMWRWLSGEPVTYMNWFTSNPVGRIYCASLTQRKQWFAYQLPTCSIAQRFICEIQP